MSDYSNQNLNNTGNLLQINISTLINILNEDYTLAILTVPAVFGVFTSALNIAIFLNPVFKGVMYDCLLWKSIFEFLIEIINSFISVTYCTNCIFDNSLASMLMEVYFDSYLYYSLYGSITLCELAIAYDRNLILKQNPKRFKIFSIKYFIPITIVLCFLPTTPLIFTFNISKVSKNSTVYVREFSDFGKSFAYRIYLFLYFGVLSMTIFILISVLSVLIIRNFKKFFEKKNKMTNRQIIVTEMVNIPDTNNSNEQTLNLNANLPEHRTKNSNNETERRLTKMVILICLTFFISRLLEIIYAISFALFSLYPTSIFFNNIQFFFF